MINIDNEVFVSFKEVKQATDTGNLSHLFDSLNSYVCINGFLDVYGNPRGMISNEKQKNDFLKLGMFREQHKLEPFEFGESINHNSLNYPVSTVRLEGMFTLQTTKFFDHDDVFRLVLTKYSNVYPDDSQDLFYCLSGLKLFSIIKDKNINYDDFINALKSGEYINQIMPFYYRLEHLNALCKSYGLKLNIQNFDDSQNTINSSKNIKLQTNIINHLDNLNNHNHQTEFLLDVLKTMQKNNFNIFQNLEPSSKKIVGIFKRFCESNKDKVTALSEISGKHYHYKNVKLEIKKVHRAIRNQINNAIGRQKKSTR